jgi:hypothetical protein
LKQTQFSLKQTHFSSQQRHFSSQQRQFAAQRKHFSSEQIVFSPKQRHFSAQQKHFSPQPLCQNATNINVVVAPLQGAKIRDDPFLGLHPRLYRFVAIGDIGLEKNKGPNTQLLRLV